MPKLCEENYLNTPNMPTSAKIIAPKRALYDILGERGIITASVAMHQKGFYMQLLKSKHLQLTFTVSGCARIRAGDEKFSAKRGNYFISPNGSNYVYDAYTAWRVFWFHLNPESFWRTLFPDKPQVRFASDWLSVLDTMRLYLRQIHMPDVSLPILEKTADLLVELLKRELGYQSRSASDALESLIEKISKNYATRLTLRELASSIGMSVSTLNRISMREYGMSFAKVVAANKMRTAKKMLLENSITNFDIAKTLGFSSESAFSKSFKKYYGFPPSRLRR